jgi:hypothetical protein
VTKTGLRNSRIECADECGVVWPYLLDGDDKDVGVASGNVESLRAEFAAVVEERRCRAASAVHLVDAEVDEGDSLATAAKVAAVGIFSQFSTSCESTLIMSEVRVASRHCRRAPLTAQRGP